MLPNLTALVGLTPLRNFFKTYKTIGLAELVFELLGRKISTRVQFQSQNGLVFIF